jgi:guanylate kinase
VIRRRLAGAARESQDYSLYDYVLVNDDLDLASARLQAIVEAEREGRDSPGVEALRRTNPAVTGRVERILASFAVEED